MENDRRGLIRKRKKEALRRAIRKAFLASREAEKKKKEEEEAQKRMEAIGEVAERTRNLAVLTVIMTNYCFIFDQDTRRDDWRLLLLSQLVKTCTWARDTCRWRYYSVDHGTFYVSPYSEMVECPLIEINTTFWRFADKNFARQGPLYLDRRASTVARKVRILPDLFQGSASAQLTAEYGIEDELLVATVPVLRKPTDIFSMKIRFEETGKAIPLIKITAQRVGDMMGVPGFVDRRAKRGIDYLIVYAPSSICSALDGNKKFRLEWMFDGGLYYLYREDHSFRFELRHRYEKFEPNRVQFELMRVFQIKINF